MTKFTALSALSIATILGTFVACNSQEEVIPPMVAPQPQQENDEGEVAQPKARRILQVGTASNSARASGGTGGNAGFSRNPDLDLEFDNILSFEKTETAVRPVAEMYDFLLRPAAPKSGYAGLTIMSSSRDANWGFILKITGIKSEEFMRKLKDPEGFDLSAQGKHLVGMEGYLTFSYYEREKGEYGMQQTLRLDNSENFSDPRLSLITTPSDCSVSLQYNEDQSLSGRISCHSLYEHDLTQKGWGNRIELETGTMGSDPLRWTLYQPKSSDLHSITVEFVVPSVRENAHHEYMYSMW